MTQQEVQLLESPLLKKPIEARLYQQIIFAEALKRNTLVVLPTGLGKTLIMVMLTAHKLNQAVKEGKKHEFVLVMSPTKPLTRQIYQTFTQYLNVLEIIEISGSTPSKHRAKRYECARVIVATPQTIENDLENEIFDLKNCLLICFDEVHRARGKYAYVNIAKDYDGHIVGFTASPSKNKETVLRVCQNLKIESIEKRSDHDLDVVKYVHRVKP
ncbi:MAG: DEAD/DEAH box helicase [Asgard group archaeon]